jgi:hypothetical protein
MPLREEKVEVPHHCGNTHKTHQRLIFDVRPLPPSKVEANRREGFLYQQGQHQGSSQQHVDYHDGQVLEVGVGS